MRKKIIYIIILLFCGYSLYFILGSTLSPIFAKLKMYYWADKIYFNYSNSCHQQPDRSFWLLGYPIALCSRCYGFYTGVLFYGITTVLMKLKINLKNYLIILSICISDILLNFWGFNTGNFIRFLIGISLGTLFIDTLFKLALVKNGEEK